MDNQESLLLMTSSHLLILMVELKSLHFLKANGVKMKFGFSLLKKHGRNFVEVMKQVKWEEQLNSSKTLWEVQLKFCGQMITKMNQDKKSC